MHRTPTLAHFAELAAAAAAAFRLHARLPQPSATSTSSTTKALAESESDGAAPHSPSPPPPLWIDDVTPELQALDRHHRSAAYRELHRPALTTSGMGLYGGEPGFEKAHRVWVDPDRPHMKHIYNQTPLAKNLRYARYGYFKRDMHLLDVDKLIRHARMLPTPPRLLTDFLLQRVTLNDRSSAAFLRYQRQEIEMVEEWNRAPGLAAAEEMFERLLVTNLPPVEVGPLSHAEMLRCCAACRDWHKGWEVYHQRATEVEAERSREREEEWMAEAGDGSYRAAGGSDDFTLGTAYFDAALALCVACHRPAEGHALLAESIRRHLRPRATMLDQSILLAAQAVEALQEALKGDVTDEAALSALLCGAVTKKKDDDDGDEDSASTRRDRLAAALKAYERGGVELWGLYDFYRLPRTSASVEAQMRLAAALNRPLMALETLRYADAAAAAADAAAPMRMRDGPLAASAAPPDRAALQPTLRCFQYLLYSMRLVGGFSDFIVELFGTLSGRGLQPDHVLFAIAFMHCALQRDGDLAVTLLEQFFLPSGCNPTPEITLGFLRACAQCEAPTPHMLGQAERLVARLEEVGTPYLHHGDVYEALMELAAQVGAVGAAFSILKRLAAAGAPELLTTRRANSLLLANANAGPPNGSAGMTEEICSMFKLFRLRPNDDTLELLDDCLAAFGTSATLSAWRENIDAAAQEAAAAGSGLGRDEDLPTPDDYAPHRLRQLRTPWHLSPRDMALRRHGQTLPMPRRQDVGSMLGSVVPFGRTPGERRVD